ncbi:MAG: hypothetical protein EBS38_06525, partial [Actinobacteria bacterium]|nr:hypothetical protein [Actinomycetota bacterium]
LHEAVTGAFGQWYSARITAIIAVGVGQEPATLAMVIGGSVMLIAMLLVEWPTKSKPSSFQERLEF